MQRDYHYYKNIVKDRPMPLAFIDIDILDQNISQILQRACGKTIRIASKSVRCAAVLQRILDRDPRFQGIMCYTATEAVYLWQQSFDDLLVAYPIWQEREIRSVCQCLREGAKIILMVDSHNHVQKLEEIASDEGVQIPLCIDIDMSSVFAFLHFGVRRSGINSVAQTLELAEQIATCKHLHLAGIMGYEAQIAGLPDYSPTNGTLTNLAIRLLKKRSVREVESRRRQIVDALQRQGYSLSLVNGGGTGSIETTSRESCVTEVTVGSGFFSPQLFDYYQNFRHLPAAAYAIEITRAPKPGIFTCRGGGYIASGAIGVDKQPLVYLPQGAKLLATEGVGEVQTPILYDGDEPLALGNPIFLRHSKAGELCEHFTRLLLIANGEIVDEVPTYRGDGQCFL